MPVIQKFNKRTGAWVKIRIAGKKTKILNVKTNKPKVPFKGVRKTT